MKIVKNEISSILTHLTKLSVETGTFPEKMKIARVSPIFKAGKKQDCNNYRPISVLPVLSKILEKVIQKKLSEFPGNINLLFSGQYGFRRSKDTEIAVNDVINNIK